MKKMVKFKPELTTKSFFKDYDPAVINEGECFIWAYFTYLLFKDVELWHSQHHAFVKYKGKFYDSERPKGERDWQDLPATKGDSYIVKDDTISKFKYAWRNQPERFNTSWEELESKARKILRSHEKSSKTSGLGR